MQPISSSAYNERIMQSTKVPSDNPKIAITVLLSCISSYFSNTDRFTKKGDFLLSIVQVRYFSVKVFDNSIPAPSVHDLVCTKDLANLKKIRRNVFSEKQENVF